MTEQFKSQNNGSIRNQVSKISGRGEEFLNFEELSADAKRAIYTEIKNIIALLQQLRGAENKEAVMEMLGENLIVNCSTHSEKFKSISERLNKKEQLNLKRRFADAILLALYRQNQIYAVQNKAVPQKLSSEIEKYVKQMQKGKLIVQKEKVTISHKQSHAKTVAHKHVISSSNRHRTS